MEESNRIINGLWIGNKLNDLQKISIRSFLEHGHAYHLYVYDDSLELPEGTIRKDANEILDKKYIFRDNNGSLSFFADLFRYVLLYEAGGWWVDLDQICIQAFDFEDKYVFATENIVNSYNNHTACINIGVIKVPRHSDIMKHCMERSFALYKENFPNIAWATFGRAVVEEYIEENPEYADYAYSPHVFCPISPYLFEVLLTDCLIEFTDESASVHFWNELIRSRKIDLDNSNFHENSFYVRMRKKYLGHGD